VPELDDLLPFVEVVVQQLRKEDGAVLTAGEREPAHDQLRVLAIAVCLV